MLFTTTPFLVFSSQGISFLFPRREEEKEVVNDQERSAEALSQTDFVQRLFLTKGEGVVAVSTKYENFSEKKNKTEVQLLIWCT